MRNLTIERRKTSAACAAKLKVYMEDPAGDLTIDNIPCRKLGELKNGESGTYTIDDEAAKLFVFYDKLSRDYSNDYYDIPAGTEDIFLSGQSKLNPTNGNAFRFDGSDNTPEQMSYHKRKNRKAFLILIPLLIVGVIAGRFTGKWIGDAIGKGIASSTPDDAKPKTFAAEGMQITLTDDFSKEQFDGFTVCYAAKESAVFTLKESFSLMDGLQDYTLEQYGQLVLQTNSKTDSTLQSGNGFLYFEYEAKNAEDGNTYYYYSTMHKGLDAFWLVQFAAPAEKKDVYKPFFTEWAESVSFSA